MICLFRLFAGLTFLLLSLLALLLSCLLLCIVTRCFPASLLDETAVLFLCLSAFLFYSFGKVYDADTQSGKVHWSHPLRRKHHNYHSSNNNNNKKDEETQHPPPLLTSTRARCFGHREILLAIPDRWKQVQQNKNIPTFSPFQTTLKILEVCSWNQPHATATRRNSIMVYPTMQLTQRSQRWLRAKVVVVLHLNRTR